MVRMIAELEKAHQEEKQVLVVEDETTRRRRQAKEASERARKLAERAAAKDRERRENIESVMDHLIRKVVLYFINMEILLLRQCQS